MKLALYPGCLMPTEQYAYEMSIRETLPLMGVEIVDLPGFSCCGEPLKSINQMLTLHMSARNLSIADREGIDLLVPCPMCHLALSEAKNILDGNGEMKKRINAKLREEGLEYIGKQRLFHIIDLVHDEIGLDTIRERVKKTLPDLNMAAHYGCHILRPSEMGRPVDSENPRKMEAILLSLGVRSEDYAEKLDCCGGPLLPNHPETSLAKTGQKLHAVSEQGFDGMVLACPWCQKMFDSKQTKAAESVGSRAHVPVLYLTQLMGLAFGIDDAKLGLNLNLSPVDDLGLKGEVE
ncbi:MAG TPA: hypothetical protein ENK47_08505 [Euryarchaeota archaeon]|nr:hypothetical protein [Euryarchaeota archaeon]